MTDIVERLRDACDGHPHAKIEWPHRVLHEAADEITRLRAALMPFAHYSDLLDCDERRDDDALEVPIGDLRRARAALSHADGKTTDA